MDYTRLRGMGVSPGVAQGKVYLTEKVVFTSRKETIPKSLVPNELDRLKKAVAQTRNQLEDLKNEIKSKLGEEHALIFDAHLLILKDKSLFRNFEKCIREDLVRAEWAISCEHERYIKIFESIEDEYFRERQSDVSDVLSKVYGNLDPTEKKEAVQEGDKIIVAHDLLPSEAATSFSRGDILAVALDMGGQTSHTAILARSLNIPAVVGLSDITRRVKNGDLLIVDGTAGEVIINPPSALQKEFVGKKQKYDDYQQELRKTAKLESKTLDDFNFYLMGNIEFPEEVEQARSMGAEGIGLFRSEFIYLQNPSLPSEEDHYDIYSRIAESAHPTPVYIRTVDVGGEKNMPQMKIAKEPNPALGLRAIRYSLRDRDIFRVQLRAILRASVFDNVRILFPMVTEIEEIAEIKILIEEVKSDLRDNKIKFNENIPLGAMIEVPAAAAITDLLVKEVDFISIGTNDLIQYYLAVDRTNELVSYLYKPLHPSILRILRFIIETSQKHGKEVTVCGEMAADPLSALVLLAFGLKTFSMNPIFIPRIKKTLRSVEYRTVRSIVQKAMTLKTAQEIEEYIIEKVLVKHPKAFLMGQANSLLS
ncbi:phosphoenolpyruvate--protein phosphotransferase [Acidobacteriota bacterium]